MSTPQLARLRTRTTYADRMPQQAPPAHQHPDGGSLRQRYARRLCLDASNSNTSISYLSGRSLKRAREYNLLAQEQRRFIAKFSPSFSYLLLFYALTSSDTL